MIVLREILDAIHILNFAMTAQPSPETAGQLTVNHISYTRSIASISRLAHKMNQRISTYLGQDAKAGHWDVSHLGIVPMDSPTMDLIDNILVRNPTDVSVDSNQ